MFGLWPLALSCGVARQRRSEPANCVQSRRPGKPATPDTSGFPVSTPHALPLPRWCAMIIRREQMVLIERAQVQQVERGLVAGLRSFSPELTAAIGDAGTHEVVRIGITKATSYGLTQRDTVRLYVELMVLFGSHFDTDPQHPW